MYYNAAMAGLLRWLVLLAVVFPAAFGCARDVNVEGEEDDKYPLEVLLRYRTRGGFSTNTWYYMVFNYSAAPNTAGEVPLDFISDENRGANWERYVVLSPRQGENDILWTLDRPRDPTLLRTALGPADVAAGDFVTGDAEPLIDLAVACREAGVVQLIAGKQVDKDSPQFFEDAVTISNENETTMQPMRIYKIDLAGDTDSDLLVLYAGDGTSGAFIRAFQGDGQGNFIAGANNSVADMPVDSVIDDFNGDGDLDLAIVTVAEEAGQGTLRIYQGDSSGIYTEANSYAVGTDPAFLAIGQLDDLGADIAVANRGTAAVDGNVSVFRGAGDGSFTEDAASPLPVAGTVTSVAFGTMLGTDNDLVVGYVDGSGVGNVGVFLNEDDQEEPFGDLFIATPTETQPYYIAVADTSGDNRSDALVVDGSPGSGGSTFLIQPGDRGGEGIEILFEWDPVGVTYLAGLEPSRIELVDLNFDGRLDVISPVVLQEDTDEDSISLFYALGKDNFTSVDVYWTDKPPELLVMQDWYISHSIGPNSFELVIDPGLFYDQARRQPDNFLVDFMTGTTGIDLDSNIDGEGEIRDHLTLPINVPMEIGHFNDEMNSPRTEIVPIESEDIFDWYLEVF